MWNIFANSTKKYFGNDDPIYDVIMQVPVKKLHENYGHEISNDPFDELSGFWTY